MHRGRFAGAYRKELDLFPSVTLRREDETRRPRCRATTRFRLFGPLIGSKEAIRALVLLKVCKIGKVLVRPKIVMERVQLETAAYAPYGRPSPHPAAPAGRCHGGADRGSDELGAAHRSRLLRRAEEASGDHSRGP